MERQFKLISIKTNNLLFFFNSLNAKKIRAFDVEILDLGLGQAQQCGGVKLVNGISTFFSW
jgi:hypothetical protein